MNVEEKAGIIPGIGVNGYTFQVMVGSPSGQRTGRQVRATRIRLF